MLSRIKRLKDAIVSKIKSFFMRTFLARRTIVQSLWRMIYSATTIAIGAYALTYFLPNMVIAAILSTFVVHEFAHWLTAKRANRKIDTHFTWRTLGAVRISDPGTDLLSDMRIHLAGPTWGFLWSVAGAGVALWYGQQPVFWAFVALAALNTWQGTFGSDGTVYAALKAVYEAENDPFAGSSPEGPGVYVGDLRPEQRAEIAGVIP